MRTRKGDTHQGAEKVNAGLRVLRKSIGDCLERIDGIRNGEFLDMYSQDEEHPEENIQLSIGDWRETVKVDKLKKGEKYSPDDDPEDDPDQPDA